GEDAAAETTADTAALTTEIGAPGCTVPDDGGVGDAGRDVAGGLDVNAGALGVAADGKIRAGRGRVARNGAVGDGQVGVFAVEAASPGGTGLGLRVVIKAEISPCLITAQKTVADDHGAEARGQAAAQSVAGAVDPSPVSPISLVVRDRAVEDRQRPPHV